MAKLKAQSKKNVGYQMFLRPLRLPAVSASSSAQTNEVNCGCLVKLINALFLSLFKR